MNPYKSKFQENDEEIRRLKQEIKAQKEEQARLDKESREASLALIEQLRQLLPKMKSEESGSEIMELINGLEKNSIDSHSLGKRIDSLIWKALKDFR